MCKSAPRSRQITTPAPHHSVFYRPDALPAAQPTASKHWRHKAQGNDLSIYKSIMSEKTDNKLNNNSIKHTHRAMKDSQGQLATQQMKPQTQSVLQQRNTLNCLVVYQFAVVRSKCSKTEHIHEINKNRHILTNMHCLQLWSKFFISVMLRSTIWFDFICYIANSREHH